MTGATGTVVDRGAAWVYEGVWGVLASWLIVPRQAPTLPKLDGVEPLSIRPGRAWLDYLRFWFWLGLTVFDGVLIGLWLIVCIVNPVLGALLSLPVFVLAIGPDLIVFVGIHLRYDTTWYVISPRSIRLRNGIWTIRETTFTFENVQNVEITQGPIERWFGFSNLKIETAGGGVTHTQHGPVSSGSNVAFLFGLENAAEVRELIMERVRASRTTGLGDETDHAAPGSIAWSGEHLAELRAIRDGLRTAAGS